MESRSSYFCKLSCSSARAYPHWPDQYWADPILDEAVTTLRTIAARRQQEGPHIPIDSKSYRDQFSALRCGARYRQRLEHLKRVNAVAEEGDATTDSSSHLPK